MYLVSSNTKKLEEFRRFGLDIDIKTGLDLPEVKGSKDDVIIHKSITAGKDTVVEDTILVVNGEEIVDIRWKIDQLTRGKAQWIVTLAHNDGEMIHVYRATVEGIIIKPSRFTRLLMKLKLKKTFGFDPYFVPNGSYLTLDELNKKNRKDDFSARRLAVLNLVNKTVAFSTKIADVPAWTGEYQH